MLQSLSPYTPPLSRTVGAASAGRLSPRMQAAQDETKPPKRANAPFTPATFAESRRSRGDGTPREDICARRIGRKPALRLLPEYIEAARPRLHWRVVAESVWWLQTLELARRYNRDEESQWAWPKAERARRMLARSERLQTKLATFDQVFGVHPYHRSSEFFSHCLRILRLRAKELGRNP